MARLLTAIALTTGLALSACATPTPYQPLVKNGLSAGGYSDLQIGADRYRITFDGNSATNRDTVERYLLFHAAELTLQSGHDWFMLANRRTDTRVSDVGADPYLGWAPEWSFYGRGRWGPGGPFFGPDPGYYDDEGITRYRATAEILMGHGKAPADNPAAFDAQDVQSHLASTVRRPQPKT